MFLNSTVIGESASSADVLNIQSPFKENIVHYINSRIYANDKGYEVQYISLDRVHVLILSSNYVIACSGCSCVLALR